MKIVKFAEHIEDKLDKFCVDEFGKHHLIDEGTLHNLWWRWLNAKNARRNDTENYTVFELTKGYLEL